MTYHQHETFRSNLPAFALGSLNDDETEAMTTHLNDCDECSAILLEYVEVMRLLPHALPVVSPPASARDTLLAKVQLHESQYRRSPWFPGAMGRWGALAAAATIILLLGTLVVTMWGRTGAAPVEENPAGLLSDLRSRPTVQMLSMTGSQHAPSAVGQIIVDPGDTRAALLVSGLPQLAADHEYQFWFVQPDDSRLSGGLFTVDANGSAIVAIEAPEEFSRAWRCGVTEEPAGGSLAPTGKNVLAASYEHPIEMEYAEPG